jgi:hypothetical protein
MKAVPDDVYSAAHRFGIVSHAGGRKVRPIAAPDLEGFHTCGGEGGRVVSEFAAGGEVIARRVETSTGQECWLRADLVELAEIALGHEAARTARAISETVAYAEATRRDADPRPADERPLSVGLIHAAMRHSKRIGRFYDMNSRGDAERGKFARQLAAARPDEGGA